MRGLRHITPDEEAASILQDQEQSDRGSAESSFDSRDGLLADEKGLPEASPLEARARRRGCSHHYAIPFVILLVVGVVSFCSLSVLLDPSQGYYNMKVSDSTNLWEFTPDHPGCVDNGGLCMCGPDHQCHQWDLQVGDVFVFGYGPDTLSLAFVNVVARAFSHGAVHAAIVTEVNGPGLGDILVTEAIADTRMTIMQTKVSDLLNHRSYHEVWIRRVDSTRFPMFASKAAAITQWANQHVGDDFDKVMLYPGIRNIADVGNFIPNKPNCAQRTKALQLYQAGGPRKWMCSQFVAWTLAFAGGLNTDYSPGGSSSCAAPAWDGKVESLQPAPGDLIHQSFWGSKGFHVVCGKAGVSTVGMCSSRAPVKALNVTTQKAVHAGK